MTLITEDNREWFLEHDGMTFKISKLAVESGYNWIGSYKNYAGTVERVLRKSVYGQLVSQAVEAIS